MTYIRGKNDGYYRDEPSGTVGEELTRTFHPTNGDGTTYGFEDANDPSFNGSDVLFFYFQGGDGNDDFVGGPNDDILKGGKGVDWLWGEDGDDHIYGGEHTDYLFGGGNHDYLFGEDGSDHLYGGTGSDELSGGHGNDFLYAGNADGTGVEVSNFLWGGFGTDLLTGGNGSDRFYYQYKNESEIDNPDVIVGFTDKDDVIDIEAIQELPLPLGNYYVEDTIDYGAGYEAAKAYALSVFDYFDGPRFLFVTDEVDGYLFGDLAPAIYYDDDGMLESEIDIGIVLEGLTSIHDFDAPDVL